MSATPSVTLGLDPATLERFADLVVGFGANVQPGQIVAVGAELGKEPLARALAASAYRHGAKFVDVQYFDLHVKRARILYADEETLDYVPPWYGERILALGEHRAARDRPVGPGRSRPARRPRPDPRRARPAALPRARPARSSTTARPTGRAVPCPTPAWAQLVHPDLDPDAALARLAEQVVHVCRLDEDDPVAAWRARADQLVEAAERAHRAALRRPALRGPGHRPHRRAAADLALAGRALRDGRRHRRTCPTCRPRRSSRSPDPARVEGVVRGDEAARASAGRSSAGSRCGSRAAARCEIDADRGRRRPARATRPATRAPRASARSRSSTARAASARSDTVFYDTLLDENAAIHIALGSAFPLTVGEEDERPRSTESEIHIDFMIGADDVGVTGITARRRPRARPARRRLAGLSYPLALPRPLERCRSG